MASTVNNPAWLEWMTTLLAGRSRQTSAAAYPPERFYCLLDELPLHLIPQRARRCLRSQEHRQLLFLNPECSVLPAEQIPDEFLPSRELLSGFALQGTIAWVRDSAGQGLLPFWLGPEFEPVVRDLSPDKPVSPSVPDRVRRVLTAARILVPESHLTERDRNREQMIGQAQPLFRQKGYAPLPDLIHPFLVAALRRYYRYLIRRGAVQLGDGQSQRRYAAYNEPVARFFHQQMAATLSAVAGEPLKPSYVYVASYLSGAELKKHTDREQCEFSITFCLDFAPEPAQATPWPISLDSPTGTVTVYQALGDGLAYRGTRLPHYRGELGQGQTSTSIFFHYVRQDFAGSLD